MPVCFELVSKGTGISDKPLTLIDEELAVALGEPIDECKWCRNWYNLIGLALACGKDWNYCRGIFNNPDDPDGIGMLEVIDWLEANYDVCSWRE